MHKISWSSKIILYWTLSLFSNHTILMKTTLRRAALGLQSTKFLQHSGFFIKPRFWWNTANLCFSCLPFENMFCLQ
jgi:hypothetical protein